MTNKLGTQSKQNRLIATQSSLELYLISKQESKNFGLTYTAQDHGTYSHMGFNVNKKSLDSKTHSSKQTINTNKIGKSTQPGITGTQSTVNKEKKFYAKPNASTQSIENCDFMEFLSKLCDNADVMLKTKNVTVNGLLVMDSNYELKSGDIVRVGVGHYINSSKQTAIVK